MNGGNPTRDVIVALALTALVLIIAGDKWNSNVSLFQPVRPVRAGGV